MTPMNQPRMRVLVPFVALLLVSMGHAAARTPATHTVTIEATQFQPNSISVHPGDTIIWVNKDPFPHTVTSKTGGFDSQQIQPGASWKYRAVKTGEFPYVCSLHPTMTGTVVVARPKRK